VRETELHRLIALVVFAGTYAGLGIGRLPPFRVDRTGVAIIGAAVMVVTGVVPWDRAVAAVDAHTLVLHLVSNVPAVLLFKSVIPSFGDPVRSWLILAMASTLAGNLTILGSVANLIVVEEARAGGIEIGFVEYSRVGVPVPALTLLVGWLVLISVPV